MIPLYKAYIPESVSPKLIEIFKSGAYAGGESVGVFETKLKEYIGNPNLTSSRDASSGITLGLFLAGVRPGDSVIASPMACVATNMPIINTFANVVWSDIDPSTGNISPSGIETAVTKESKAILYSHYSGDVADIDEIRAVADKHGLAIIEDAGEALGAKYKDRRIGDTGADVTVFSFHAIRHLTTGDGAAITFRDEEVWEKARWLTRYGIHQPTFRDELGEINPESDIPVAGYSSYLTNIAAAIGVEQMGRIDSVVSRHQANGTFFDEKLSNIAGIRILKRSSETKSAYWVYTLLAERRDDLLRVLRDRGVFASKVHLRNDKYSCFSSAEQSLEGLDKFSSEYLSIPSGWWVSDEDRELIVEAIRQGW